MDNFRTGIAMIELIFALVIMGIVMMSAPMLIGQSQKSTQVVLQQEAIAAGASDLSMILSRHWDEADTNITLGAPVLVVNNGSPLLNDPRAGTPTISNRNFNDNLGGVQNATLPSRFGPAVAVTLENDDINNSFDDMDDFATIGTDLGTLSIADAALRGDLVDTDVNTGSGGIQFDTEITYVVDANTTFDASSITFNPFNTPVSGTSNVKMIQITVTSGGNVDELEKKIIFKAFSSNIGEYELAQKGF